MIVFLPLDNPFRCLLLVAYVGAVLTVRAIELLSRFLLAPRASSLRWIPLSDAAASIFHRWIAWIALAAGASLLISVFMELERTDEGMVVLTRGVTGLVVVLPVIAAMIWNRESISGFIRTRTPESSAAAVALRTQLADIWIHFTVPYVAAAWILWVLILLRGRAADVAPPIALWAVPPIYLVLNATVQKMIDLLTGGASSMSGVGTSAAPVEGEHPGGAGPSGGDRPSGGSLLLCEDVPALPQRLPRRGRHAVGSTSLGLHIRLRREDRRGCLPDRRGGRCLLCRLESR